MVGGQPALAVTTEAFRKGTVLALVMDSGGSTVLSGYASGMFAADPLLEVAVQQHGYVTTEDARRAGVDPQRLRAMAMRGRAEQRARGLYRLTAVPRRPHDEYAEAVLLGGADAVLGGEAALDLWGLADVNPRQIEVVVPPAARVRRQHPDLVFVHRALATDDVDEVEDIPVVAPPVAISMAMAGGIDGTLVEQAITTAQRRGLIGSRTAARLLVELDDHQRARR